jgi:hypothetical protein
VGLYTVTFSNKWGQLNSFQAGLRIRAAEPATIAVGSVVSAANKTATIRVFQAATGTVTPAGGVLTKAPGTVNVDISSAREIAGDAIQNLAAVGGLLASDSVPSLTRVNAATDKALQVSWAATEVDEIALPPIAWPVDLDPAADVIVHLLLTKNGNTDNAAVIGVNAFEGWGDANFGGNTQALNVAANTMFDAQVTLAHANIAGSPNVLNLAIIPGAHANDAIRLHGVYLEYTRRTWAVSAVTGTGTAQTWALADLTANADNEIDFTAILRNSNIEA